MTSRRALLVVTVLSATRTSGAEPCAPRAALDGDREVVATVGAELVKLGVTLTTDRGTRGTSSTDLGMAHAACPLIVAAVEVDRDGGIAVAVRDGAQRSEGRVVSDAFLAAAWIDSWLRDDFEAPITLATIATPVVTTSTAVPVETARLATPERSIFDRASIAVAFDSAWSGDSRWNGFSAAGCARLDGFCIGARARYSTQDVVVGQTAASRDDASLLVTASAARDVGRMAIAPELGLGVGRLAIARVDGCKPLCDPSDPSCGGTGPPPAPACSDPATSALQVGDGLRASSWTPRASAALRVAIPLFDHVWLDGIAAITLAPFGHGDPYLPAPNILPPGVPPGALALPGDPLAMFQLGVGLRVGAP